MAGEVVKFEHVAPPQRRSFDEVSAMAKAIVESKLWGQTTVPQVVALMLMAEAEGRHVASAMQDYIVISGKPSLKAEAMLGRFQRAGGHVRWTAMSDNKVAAVFSHPQCDAVEIEWDHERAKRAGITNAMYKKYPRQMLRARVISEGVRTAFPGALGGMYAPEEVMDFEPSVAPPRAGAPAIAPPRDAEATAAGAVNANDAAPVASYASVNEDGEEVDQTTQPEWPILESEMEAFSTREDLKSWWLSPEKKALKQSRPHLMRAFYRFAYIPRLEDLAETVEWTDEAGARG